MLSRFACFTGVTSLAGRFWALAALLGLLALVPVNLVAAPKPPATPTYSVLRVPLSSANLPPIVVTNPDGSQSAFPLAVYHSVGSHRLNDQGDLLFHASATLAPGTPSVFRSFVYLRAEDEVYPLSDFSTVQLQPPLYVAFTSDRKVLFRNHATATVPQDFVQVYSIDIAFDGAGDPIQSAPELIYEADAPSGEWIVDISVFANNWSDLAVNLLYEDEITGARRKHLFLVRQEIGGPSTQDFPMSRLTSQGYLSTSIFLGGLNDVGQLLGSANDGAVPGKTALFRYDFETDGLVLDIRLRGANGGFFLNDLGKVVCKSVSTTNFSWRDAALWNPDKRTFSVLAYETQTSSAFSFTNMKGISRVGDAIGYTIEFKNGAYLPTKHSLFKGGKSYNVKQLAPTNTWLQAATMHTYNAAMNAPGQIYVFAYDGATGQDNLLFLTPQ